MSNDQTLTHLYSKGRNRFAKVMFIFLYIVILLVTYGVSTEGELKNLVDFIIPMIIVLIIFELIKRAFYYIALGTVRPKK